MKKKSESLANEISYNQAILIEREHGIQQMQATMMEINEIFKDIDVIVGEQGDFVGTHSDKQHCTFKMLFRFY